MKKRIFSHRHKFLASVVLVILGLALSTWVAQADTAPSTYSFYTGTDLKVSPPAPALGPANSVLIDPTFGSHILRVTDQNTKGGLSFIPANSGFQRSFNANSTAIKLEGPHGDSYWMEFDPGTFKVGNGSSQPVPHALSFDANWEWSAVDPDIIYFLNGNKIAKYNKSTNVTTNLGGPPTGEPVTYAVGVVGQDNWVCSAAGSGYQDSYTKIYCVNPTNTSSVQFIDVPNQTINGVKAANLNNWPTSAPGQVIGIHGLSGGTGSKWLQVTFHRQSWGGNGDSVFNLAAQTWSLATGADYYWNGHVSMGNGTFANGAGSRNGSDSRGHLLRDPDNLMNSSSYRFIGQPPAPSNGWCDAEHSSWLNSGSNPNAPILVSRYTLINPCQYTWSGEIDLLAVDGSNTVWRVAHNHNGGTQCFYAESFAQISSDGKWALFSSYWDGKLGADTAFGCSTRIDTFLVDLTGASSGSSSTASSGSTSGTTSGTTTGSSSGSTGSSSGSTPGDSGTPTGGTSTSPSGTAGTTRIQESDPSVSYTGTWFRLPASGTNTIMYNGGSAEASIDVGSVATLSFNGTGVTFITYSDAWSGIAQIYVDGNPTAKVDLYAANGTQRQAYTVSGLPSGPHTVGIGPTGTKNAAAQSSWTQIDAFDVLSSSPPIVNPPPTPPATTTTGSSTGTTGSTSGSGTAPTPPATTTTGSSTGTAGSTSSGSTPGSTTTSSSPSAPTTGTSGSGTTTPGGTASGGQTLSTAGSQTMQIGSAAVITPAGQAAPSGLAIIGYRSQGVLVSEAGVPGAAPANKGRIYAYVSGVVSTGIAIANENSSDATVSFFFTDAGGTDFGTGSITIPAHGQIAKFLDEAPFNAPRPTDGTFTFNSNVPVSAIAIRGLTNERSEFLVTTLPIANPDTDANVTDSVFFPHFASGGGWTTQFVLVNPSNKNLSGTLSFSSQGTPGAVAPSLALNIDGAVVTQLTYSIPPRSSKRYSTVSTSSQMTIGSAQVTPTVLNPAPVGVALFSFNNRGITVSEAGTSSMGLGSAFRVYAEVDQSNSIKTGTAIRNSGNSDATVNFTLTGLDGTSTGLSGKVVIPALGQKSVFVDEIPGFESLATSFKGVLRISSTNGSITVLGLRGRWNERGDFIFTSTPAINESTPAPSTVVFPHIVDGGGYSTQVIMFSGTPAEPNSGNLQLFSQSGGSLNISLR